MELKNLSANWKKLQATLQQQKTKEVDRPGQKSRTTSDSLRRGSKRKRTFPEPTATAPLKRRKNDKPPAMGQAVSVEDKPISTKDAQDIALSISRKSSHEQARSRPLTARDQENEGLAPDVEVGKYVAIDCEMVGVGPNPDKESALARVSAVNFNGDQIYDSYVLPKEQVTDWRTHVSGIQPKHMAKARTLEDVQKDIVQLLDGRVLVGHAIKHDLHALLISHPKRDIRDTAKHHPFRRFAGGATPKLKILASELLGINIQTGEHSSVEDARACMLIFRREKDAFDQEHSRLWRPVQQTSGISTTSKPRKKKKTRKSKRS